MREVEYIISGDDTAWMTKPPAVTGFEEPGQAIDMWEVPGPGGYRRILTRIHYNWRQNSFHPDHPTLPKKIDQLDPYRVTFLWNTLDSNERKIILDFNWETKWVEDKWVGYTVFLVKYDPRDVVKSSPKKE